MATPRSAKNAVVRINGSTLAHVSWEITPTCQELESSNSEGGGYEDYEPGMVGGVVRLTYDFDTASPQFSNPPNLVAGAEVTNILLYTNSVGSSRWSISSALVTESPMTANVKELLKCTATLRIQGSFSFVAA